MTRPPHAPAAIRAVLLLAPVLVLSLAALCGCQRAARDADRDRVALSQPETDGPLVLHVRSDAFNSDQEIPEEFTAYGENTSPPLGWSGVPDSAKSVVVIVEDPDATKPKPFVHWILFNVNAAVHTVASGVPNDPSPNPPLGSAQGRNSKGTVGYAGPKPPRGEPAHHYHFQVFALDRFLNLQPGVTREELLRQMNGHVVAKGQLVGTYRER